MSHQQKTMHRSVSPDIRKESSLDAQPVTPPGQRHPPANSLTNIPNPLKSKVDAQARKAGKVTVRAPRRSRFASYLLHESVRPGSQCSYESESSMIVHPGTPPAQRKPRQMKKDPDTNLLRTSDNAPSRNLSVQHKEGRRKAEYKAKSFEEKQPVMGNRAKGYGDHTDDSERKQTLKSHEKPPAERERRGLLAQQVSAPSSYCLSI